MAPIAVLRLGLRSGSQANRLSVGLRVAPNGHEELNCKAIGSATVEQLLTVDDAERLAEQAVTPEAWSYIVGGAGDERTLRWNREAFSRFRFRPRVLVDVTEVATQTTVLGTPVSMPALVAPMAFQQIAHEEGEAAMARGAGAAGTLMCVSTVATSTPEEIAAAAPGAPRWLQIYVFRDRGVSDDVIERALAAGFTALVLTADLPVYGIRHRESRTGFEAPEDDVPAIVAARAESERHHVVGTSPHASVERHLRAISDSLDDLRQGLEGRDRAVELAPSVVRDDNARGPVRAREVRVLRRDEPLHDDRDVPALAELRDVLPLEAGLE